MPFVELPAGRFHYGTVGAGHPFVFQHGLGGDIGQPLAGAENFHGWQTAAMDCRGHGQTAASLDPGGLSFGQFAEDLAACLDALSVGRAVVGGISMGAGVALAFAASHPERVVGLVLVRPAWLDQPFPENLRWFPQVASLLETHPPEEAMRRFQRSPEFARLEAESKPAADSLVAQFQRPQARARATVLAAMPASVPVMDLTVCGRLEVPTLVVVNERDPVPPTAMGETLAAVIPGAAFCRITSKAESEARHQTDLVRAVANFLDLLTPRLDTSTRPITVAADNLSAVWQGPGTPPAWKSGPRVRRPGARCGCGCSPVGCAASASWPPPWPACTELPPPRSGRPTPSSSRSSPSSGPSPRPAASTVLWPTSRAGACAWTASSPTSCRCPSMARPSPARGSGVPSKPC